MSVKSECEWTTWIKREGENDSWADGAGDCIAGRDALLGEQGLERWLADANAQS